VDGLRAEVQSLRRDNEALEREVSALSTRMELVTARLTRGTDASRTSGAMPQAAAPAASASASVVPPDLAVVKIAPLAAGVGFVSVSSSTAGSPAPGRRSRAAPPPVHTDVTIAEPSPDRLAALSRPSKRELATEADAELKGARARKGLDGAHGLEDFAQRYPRHPSADNALLEAAAAYASAGVDDASCALARRVTDEYPAGDAMSGALELLAGCEGHRGAADGERKLLQRLVAEYPGTPAANRAGARLASISGTAGEPSPEPAAGRSSP
jgi:TolA-binding protein